MEMLNKFKATYTSAKVQIIIVSFIAFCCPGIFNAMNGLGGAGQQDPTVANNANTALYACFALFGYFGGLFFNLFGNRLLMGCGGATYCFYAVSQYLAGHNSDLGWLAILSGALLGVGAGLFWTAQGAMMMAYATVEKKGTYISTFWVIFNLGGLFGGLLTFGLNFNSTKESADPGTYFVFAGLMALGSISAFFLLCNPSSVIREDGAPVKFDKATGPLEELKSVAMMFTHPSMLLLTPLFVSSNWFYTHQFNAVNGGLFTVRTRGLNSAMYWGAQMLGAFLFGQKFLDNASMSRKKRAIIGCAIMGLYFTFAYCIGAYMQLGYEGGYDRMNPAGKCFSATDTTQPIFTVTCDQSNMPYPIFGSTCQANATKLWVRDVDFTPINASLVGSNGPHCVCESDVATVGVGATGGCSGIYRVASNQCAHRIDVADSARYAFPIIVFLVYGMNDAMLQTFAYWIMGAITNDVSQSARFAGYYKGVQSAGAAIAWSIDNSLACNPRTWVIQMGICWALLTVSLPFTFVVCATKVTENGGDDDAVKGGGGEAKKEPM